MHQKFQNIILNGKKFQPSELQNLISAIPWKNDIYEFIKEWLDESPTIQAKTSGTTGTPKTIHLQKNKMVASALQTGAYFDLKKNAKALLCLSPNYIAGKMMLVRAFVLGLDLFTVEPSGQPLKNTNFEEIDFAAMVPLQVTNSLQDEGQAIEFKKIKKLIIGGGVVSKTLHEMLQKEKTACYATYGMTETITHVAVKKLNGNDASDFYETLENVNVTIDTRGCLVIDAPDVAEGKVVTNDLVKIAAPDKFQWLGRFDNIINSGGVKIIPEHVEALLSKILERRFFLSSRPDEVLGERLILITEGAVFSKKEKEDLITFMKNNLSKFSIPREIFFVEKFTETESGKIKRVDTQASI